MAAQDGRQGRIDDEEALTVADNELLGDLIRRYAKRLARELNDAAVDSDDVAQDFWLRLLPALAKYRQHRGPLRRFAGRLLKRQRVSMIRSRYAAKRSARSGHSATEACGLARATSLLGDSLTYADGKRHLGQVVSSPFEAVDQRCDQQVVLSKLPPNQARLAQQLTQLFIAEIARLEGISRTTVNDRVRTLRRPFEEAGLNEFAR